MAQTQDLSLLQNCIKRDPQAYFDEFEQQLRHFQSMYQIFELNPSKDSKHFGDLVNFLAHAAPCYPKEMANFPKQLMALLEKHHAILDAELRKSLCQCVIMMRNRGLIEPDVELTLFFKLFRCQDKALRKLLHSHIVNDIKGTNAKRQNNKLNKTLQNLLYSMLQDSNPIAAKCCLDVIIELYRRRVWTDARTVNVISTACFSEHTKMMVAALKFFVSDEGLEIKDEDDEGPEANRGDVLTAFRVGPKTAGRKKKLERALAKIAQKSKKPKEKALPNFPAIRLIYDPQGFGEKLFSVLKKSKERFEVRIMMMNLVSRVIAAHQLIVLNFYPFLQKYLQPHQQHVTTILAAAAQACHEQVPPDAIEPMLRALVQQFVSDRASPEVITVGLNTCREICLRQPLVMTQELLQDLVQYKNSKYKGVHMAARSLIQLFRAANPELLHKRDRGKFADMENRPEFGKERVAEGIDGVELLDGEEAAADDEDAWSDKWGQPEKDPNESSSGEGEWIDMPQSPEPEAKPAGKKGGKGSKSDSKAGPAAAEAVTDDSKDYIEIALSDDEDDESGEWFAEEKDAAAEAGAEAMEADAAADSSDEEADGDEAEAVEEDGEEGGASHGGKRTAADVASDAGSAVSRGTTASSKQRLDQIKILTPKDYELIRQKKAQKAIDEVTNKGTKNLLKRKRDEADLEDMNDPKELVDVASIEMFRQRRKLDAEGKRASVMAGREGREKFGGPKKTKEGGGRTNKEKNHAKNPTMLKGNKQRRNKYTMALHEKAARNRALRHTQFGYHH